MSQKIQLFLIVCIAIATGALVLNARRPQEPVLQEITIVQPKERTITVTSNGEIKVKPDTAEFTVFIQVSKKELADAKMENEKTFLRAMTILENHAVEQKDIKSEELRVKVDTVGGKIFMYYVSKSLSVTLHDLAELEPLFTDLQEAGIYRIERIVISHSNINQYRQQVLQIAVKNAEEKARATAMSLNRDIGQPISIQENSYSSPEQIKFTYSDLDSFTMNSKENYSNFRTVTAEIIVGVQVTVIFELK